MLNLYLKVPTIQELHYRQEWMRDSKTMAYNAGFDLKLNGYDKETGIINKSDEELLDWFDNWINKEPDRYFAYIFVKEISEPVGEVYYYLDDNIHSMGILIQDKYRGESYSYDALLELEKVAFEKNNIDELSDIFPLDRISAIKVFKKAGFVYTGNEKIEKVFGKNKVMKQLLITKGMYFKNKKEMMIK